MVPDVEAKLSPDVVAFTVSTKLVLWFRAPSLTFKVMVAVPV